MNDTNTMAANLIAARGNRCTAAILGWMENHVKDDLTDAQWRAMRQQVMEQINGFKDLAIDVVKSDTAYVNELWMEKLESLHDDLRSLRREQSRRPSA